tara:strand:- start:143 stop:688 length:546 start_codon:yes stop_codon:yes gene_type:complete
MAKTFPDILRLADGSSGSFASMDTQQIRGTATQIDDFTSASLAKIGSGLAGSLGKRALGHIVTISGSATKSPAYYVYSQTGSGDTNLSGSEWTTLTNWGKIVTSDDNDNVSFNTITSSKVLVNAPNSTDDFFLLKSGSLDSLKVNNEGVLQLGGFTFEPTPIKGGLYYNDSDDEFYAGKNN